MTNLVRPMVRPLTRPMERDGFGQPVYPTLWQPFDKAVDMRTAARAGSVLDFSRGTTAWYFGSDGYAKEAASDEPRFDHDPATGDPLGILVEGSATNELLDSRDPSTGNWTDELSSKTQNAIGLDGVANKAWTLTDSSSNEKRIYQIKPIADDTNSHTYIALIKKNSGNEPNAFVGIRFAFFAATKLLHIETLDSRNGSHQSAPNEADGNASVTDAGEYWRVAITMQNNASGNKKAIAYVYPAYSTELGGGQEGSATGSIVYDFGAIHLNRSTAPLRPPRPTGSSAETRAADRSITTVVDGDYATHIISARTGYVPGVLWQLDDGTENNRIRIERNASNEVRCIITDSGTEQANLNVGTVADNTAFKVGLAWAANDIAAVLDGGTVQTDGTATIPTGLTNWRTGHDTAGEEWNGWTGKQIAYPSRQSNDELVRQTT